MKPDQLPWPSATRAWALVAVLFAAYIASFVDRTILSLLVEPLKSELDLDDVQIGLVSGLAFGVFYALMGLPLGWLVDRRSRRVIVISGIATWSLATAACGLAQNFTQLFIARVLVGAGEAALAPAALSLIADMFPPERRARPVATFVMAGSVGGGAAMILGAGLIDALSTLSGISLPFMGTVAPWRLVFLSVGLPGLLLCAAVAAVGEPQRRGSRSDTEDHSQGFPAFLKEHAQIILPLFVAMTLLSVVAYGFLAWIPSFFIRSYGWTAEQVGLRFGTIFLLLGCSGALSGGWIASHLRAKGLREANILVVLTGLSLLLVPAVLAPLQSDPWHALAWFAPVMFFFAFPSGAAAAAIQDISPNRFRGQTVALYYIVMSLFGLSLGAVAIAAVAAHVPQDSGSLGIGMAATAAALLPAAAFSAQLARRAAR